MAWSVLFLGAGLSIPDGLASQSHHRSRARSWLNSHSLASHAARLRARARREAFAAHPSELKRLAERQDVMLTGISAALLVGVHGGRDDVELYASVNRRDELIATHALEPGDGPVLVRWVPGELWPSVASDVAPTSAVLIDLLEHDDPRARREAARVLSQQ